MFLIVISPVLSYMLYVISSLVKRFVNPRFPNPWFPRDPTLIVLRSSACCWVSLSFDDGVGIFALEKVSVIVYHKQTLYYYYLYDESCGQALGQVVC